MTLPVQMAVQATVGFAIGAGTNELAIRWVLSTLLTKKKKLIASNLKKLIYTELLPASKITEKVVSPEVKALFERDVSVKLGEIDKKARALVGGLGKDFDRYLPGIVQDEIEAFVKVADLFDDDLRSSIARICANQMTAYLADNLPRFLEEADIWNIVYEKVMGYDERKLESLIREVANRELRGVTLWGGAIGAGVGLFMSIVMWLLG